MPKLTVTHEAPLELIKQHPALAVDLLRAVTGTPFRAGLDVRLASTSLNTVTPVQYSADSVVVVSDPDTREALAAIIVEPQGRDEKTKKFSWPVYLASARKEIGCDSAYLIVACPDPAEAEGCRAMIPLGQPGLELWPIVIDPEHAPDGEDAGPYMLLFLACLPALDLTAPGNAERVLAAIRDTGATYTKRKRLSTIILNRASAAAQAILEGLMESDEWKNDFIESYVKIGVDQGREEGRQEGRQEGHDQGAAETKANDILKVIDARDLNPTKKQRENVTAAAGLDRLNLWFDRALTAKTAAAIFKDED